MRVQLCLPTHSKRTTPIAVRTARTVATAASLPKDTESTKVVTSETMKAIAKTNAQETSRKEEGDKEMTILLGTSIYSNPIGYRKG